MNGELDQNCVATREQLPMLLYGELSFDEEETVESHLDDCAACRSALERERELSAAFDQVAVEPSRALLQACREDLAARLALEPAPSGAAHIEKETVHTWWDKFIELVTMPTAMMRPAGALALLAIGFIGARVTPGVLPGFGGDSWSQASLANLGTSRVRSVEPAADGTLHIVLDETRQRTIDGAIDDAEVRSLLLAATKDPVDGLRGEIVALLTKQAQALDVRNALVYTIRNDQNAGVRLKALDGLQAFIGEDEVRGALTDVLAADGNPAMRIRAVDLLVQGLSQQNQQQAQVVDRRMIGVLQELMNRQEENPYMRERCQRALELVKASAELF